MNMDMKDRKNNPEAHSIFGKARRAAGRGMAAETLLAAAFFLYRVYATQLIPRIYLFLTAMGMAVLIAGILLLTKNPAKKVRFLAGTALCIVATAAALSGSCVLLRTMAAVGKITEVRSETASVGIYVKTENKEAFGENAPGYLYGILAEPDRAVTKEAVSAFGGLLGTRLRIAEYAGVPGLIDALLEEDTDAIILNEAYLALLEETEGYTDLSERISRVKACEVEAAIANSGKDDIAVRKAEAVSGPVFTVYISGMDSGTSLKARGRSDVNILAVVNAQTRQVLLVSTPRDYYISLPVSGGKKDKLTHAGIYGIAVSMDAVSALYDIEVDYFFKVNYGGFEGIIDALGGITVFSEYTFDTVETPDTPSYHFDAGENFMAGDEALAFCRERHAFADGDRQRGKNQMAVIKGVINRLMSADLLTGYASVLEAVENCFETSVPYDLISELVRSQLAGEGAWNVVSYSVDGTGDYRNVYSMSAKAYVMIPDEETVRTAKELIRAAMDKEALKAP